MASNNLAKGLDVLGIPHFYDYFTEQGVDSVGKLLLLAQDDARLLQIGADQRELLYQVASIVQLLADDDPATLDLLGLGGAASVGPLDRDFDLSKSGKRKYKRHPKPDPTAPQAPNSAYVVFSNEYRNKYVEDQTAFTQIAKAVGKAWREMDERERSRREKDATVLKQEFHEKLRKYKDTKEYSDYKKYLDRFKAEELDRRTRQATTEWGREATSGRRVSATDLASKTPTISPIEGANILPLIGEAGQSLKDTIHYIVENLVRLLLTHMANRGLILCQQTGRFDLNNDEGLTLNRLLRTALERQSSRPSPSQQVEEQHESLAYKLWTIMSQDSGFSGSPDLRPYFDERRQIIQGWSNLHDRAINPFHFQPQEETRVLLYAFTERVNHTFFFFEDSVLLENLDHAYDGETEHSRQTMCELCLALAIGSQWAEEGNDNTAMMWYENGRRYMDDTPWDHEPWVMRAMTMISIYHLGTRPDNSQHYLSMYDFSIRNSQLTWPDVAIRIAQANGLFNEIEQDIVKAKHENQRWLRVRNTMMIIHRYGFQLSLIIAFYTHYFKLVRT